jgi:hypothetical protein
MCIAFYNLLAAKLRPAQVFGFVKNTSQDLLNIPFLDFGHFRQFVGLRGSQGVHILLFHLLYLEVNQVGKPLTS